jgi:hypothetical protein
LTEGAVVVVDDDPLIMIRTDAHFIPPGRAAAAARTPYA